MLDSRISRRDFLKLMGAGAAALAVGKFLDSQMVKDVARPLFGQAQAQSGGPWTTGYLTSIAPIHAILLPTGKILAIAGSGYHVSTLNGPYRAEVIDPATGSKIAYTLSEDIFCSHHNHLANGNILITGGMLKYDVQNPEGRFLGLNAAYEFNVQTNTFQKVQSMVRGRWYPTNVILPDGKVWVHDGLDEYGGRNALVEIYDPATRTFSIKYDPSSNLTYTPGADSSLPGAGSQTYGGPGQGTAPFTSLYPRMHLMPSGMLCVSGMDHFVYLINPTTGTWTLAGQTQYPWRDYGTSVLLPLQNTTSERGRILIAGGQSNYLLPATATAEMIDFNQGTATAPVYRSTASMNIARVFPLPVFLPTGRLVLFGGAAQDPNDYIHTPESFDPVTETWSTLPDAGVSRTYHSTALLLPDGRVWTASGTPDRSTWEHRVEFYNPPYYYQTRPQISGRVTSAPYGGTIRIPTTSPNITRVSLIRLGANTHHYDSNLRFVWLQVTGTDSSGVNVAAPINASIAPPGHYMIHILNSQDIPSQAQIIRIPG
ncbi:galactose oxidase-like domain-containing protein [Nitrososphaera sp.]|uniref:galactose oxidase-like domain-containing protein n=1 Tax=Nitrososphaera sp. TaxID=1971748 RepID=UPI00307DB0E3